MSKAHRPVPTPIRQRAALSVAPFEGFDRATSIGVPQEIIDDQLATFTEGELKVLLAVVRATAGGSREQIPLSVRVLCQGSVPEILPGKGTGLSPRTVQAACGTLEMAGRLRVVRRTAPDGSGLPSLFSLPLLVPGMGTDAGSSRFAGYAAARKARIPLLVIDRLMAELSGAELKVLLYLLRHTFSVGVAEQVVPMARLVERSGLSLRHTRLAASGLATRGLILVQHRQDPERGKLPSSFGVRVIGERAPFSTTQPAMPVARAARAAAQPGEPSRAVWLVPEPEAATALPSASSIQIVPPAPSATFPVDAGEAPASMARHAGESTVSESVQSTSAATRREIPAYVLRDNHPAWAGVKRLLAARIPHQYFMDWVAPTTSTNAGAPGMLLIAVPSEFIRLQLETKLSGKVRQALMDAGYGELQVRYINYKGYIPKAPSEG